MRKQPDSKILKEIDQLFGNAKKHPALAIKYVAKARKLAKRNNLSLKKYRKLFCRKCNSYFASKNSQIRIRKGMKSIKCLKCGAYRRFKLG